MPPQPLGRSLAPIPGESLPGLLLRLSFRLGLPPARLAELTGLTTAGQGRAVLPASLLTGIPEPARRVFARMTRLTDLQVTGLGLAAWRGRYPLPASAPEDAGPCRPATRLAFTPATRYCPECLAGDGSAIQESFGGPWLKAWHLPVVFACPAHQRLLEHCCPKCGQAVRGCRRGAHSTLLPAIGVAGLHPAQCRARLSASNGQSFPACCGARLDQAASRRAAGPELIALQRKLLGLLDPDGPASILSAGQPAQPASYFADLRALGLLACSTWPAARDLSPSGEAASAIDQHVASLRQQAAERQGASPASASRTRFDSLPIDTAASAGLAHIADRILAVSPRETRAQLSLLLPSGRRKASQTYWGQSVLRSATPCSEGLQAAYAPLLRAYTRAGSQPQARRNAVLRPQRWGAGNIPALLPADWHDRHFTPIPGTTPRSVRRTAALRLVQMVAGGTIGEAAEFLGTSSADATWSGTRGIYTVTGHVHARARTQPDPFGLEAALEALARELDDPATPLVNYQQRRHALETWHLDESTWTDLVTRLPTVTSSRPPDTGDRKRQFASIYIWTQVTSGEHHFAPRPIEAAQPPDVRQAWKGQWAVIWAQMHRSRPGAHYRALKAELDTLAASLANITDTHARQPPSVVATGDA